MVHSRKRIIGNDRCFVNRGLSGEAKVRLGLKPHPIGGGGGNPLGGTKPSGVDVCGGHSGRVKKLVLPQGPVGAFVLKGSCKISA